MAKTYVGNGKKRSATWLKVNLDVEKLIANAYAGKNGKKYINKQYLVVSYTTRTRKGKYWNPMFDHIAGEGER